MEPQASGMAAQPHLAQRQDDLLQRIAQVRREADERIALMEETLFACGHRREPRGHR